MNSEKFQKVIDGKLVQLYHIFSQNISCFITNYGARVVSLTTRDKDSRMVDVVLGFDNIDGYLEANEQYHGATVGRYANRIANGSFSIGNEQYILDQNNGVNSLHGGVKAFHNQVWECLQHEDDSILLELISPDMQEGFPGKLKTHVRFTIVDSTLQIQYEAISTKDTVINLTHHSYFNLNGEGSGTTLQHYLKINSEYYTPVNETTIPTGALNMVADTPFDFTKTKSIGEHINNDHEQLTIGFGYDHNFVLNQHVEGELNYAAEAIGDKSKIKMEVWTTEPGVQFYSANHLDGSDAGKSGHSYTSRSAFCLETQHFPDSPNQNHFPSALLSENQIFRSFTEYRFSTV
ncbi:MAG: aldose epimerase family protein [Bacteroidota bacterium]